MIRQNSHSSSSYTVICKMGLTISCLAHLPHLLLSMDWPIGSLHNHKSSLRGSNVAEMALDAGGDSSVLGVNTLDNSPQFGQGSEGSLSPRTFYH